MKPKKCYEYIFHEKAHKNTVLYLSWTIRIIIRIITRTILHYSKNKIEYTLK